MVPVYAEFFDPRLAALYDALNPLGADSEFFCREAERLAASSIIDLGCGTGLLTCELAKRGHHIIGIDPSSAMLEIARRKSYSDKVQWVQGSSEQMENFQAAMILMTSHVAQFFLDDERWKAMLRTAHKALQPGGHIVFDSRNPLTKPWERWTRETSHRKIDTLSGQVETWHQLRKPNGNRVLYEIHYRFIDSGDALVSANELIYRSHQEIAQSLSDAGFTVEHVYGDWDRSPATITSPEMIFVGVL